MLISFGLSAPAEAGYTVTLTQQGSNVVATGMGTIDLTDLVPEGTGSISTGINPSAGFIETGSSVSIAPYGDVAGPATFGSGGLTEASSSSTGDAVGINPFPDWLNVPAGYVSGAALSDTSIYDNATFASLGATPGTYEWTWGTGAHADSFTLQIGAVPAPVIGRGLPVFLVIGGLLFAAKLLERSKTQASDRLIQVTRGREAR